MKILINLFILFFIVDLLSFLFIKRVLRKTKYIYASYFLVLPLFVSYASLVQYLISSDSIHSGNFALALTIGLTIYISKIILLSYSIFSQILKLSFRRIKKRELLFDFNKYNWVIVCLSLSICSYAIFFGRKHIQVKEFELRYTKFPKSVNELKVVQFSDFHLGSFWDIPEFVEDLVETINSQNPDIVVFTGDMVNFKAEEIKPYLSILSKIKAKYGKFSILGNHDYGYYVEYKDSISERLDKEQNVLLQEACGFRVLQDEIVVLPLGYDSIEIIGVEFWGSKEKRQYANPKLIPEQSDQNKFRILLTHGPLYWEEFVDGKETIELSLAGHTHGGQLSIDLGLFDLNPLTWFKKSIYGMYGTNESKLYINAGLGSNGFFGRIGAYPEVTVFKISSED